ncbi:metal-dependent hydrolase [Dialister sp.]|uniref:metal-dependent hydrolase n=1 Tax=Dialister sp. TaxID=1955814 RepID=UPI002E81EAF0|nr:metal-dependent hydrolase [Dialister sp.]MEE3452251.1 metal-dependent hydrolase [Dialister sp.]
MKYTFLGHACFKIDTGKERLLFDPFLTGNSQAAVKADKVRCDYILLSHAHGDHFGDANEIALRTGALVVAIPEVISLFSDSVSNFQPMNLGGQFKADFGTVKMVQAWHSCGAAGGIPCGFIIKFNDGPTVYYSGDTALFGDMKLFGELFDIDYAIMPIGDNYTMGPDDALLAAKFLKAKHVIPLHYNTWPVIAQNAEDFKKSAGEKGIDVMIVKPGETIEL